MCRGTERKLGKVDGDFGGAAATDEKLHAQATGAKVEARLGAKMVCIVDLAASCRTSSPVQRCILLIMNTCSMQNDCHTYCCCRRQH